VQETAAGEQTVRAEKNPVYWFYGSAGMAFGIKNNAFSYLLLIYSTQVLGISGTSAAFALAIAMCWDAVSDLLLGQWTDKTRSRMGRRHPFMYLGLLTLPISFYALFNPIIELTDDNKFLYLLVMALAIRTAVTLFEVPSVALLPDLVKDYDERNKWLTLRHFFGWFGGNGVHTLNMFFWTGAAGFTVASGYATYGVVGALVIAATIITSTLGTQKAASVLPQPTETFKFSEIITELSQIFQSLRNPNFGSLFTYSLIVGAASGMSTALYLYNVTYFFQFTGLQIAITGCFVLASPFISYPIAPMLGKRLGKRHAAIAALSGAIILYPMPYLLTLNGLWPEPSSTASLICYSFFVMAEVVGFIVGGVMLDSMMADIVEESEIRTNRRSEGLFYAARSFGAKAVSALGIVSAGIIVSFVGMDGIRSATEMTYDMRVDLASFFLPAYCGLYFIAIWIMSRYRIDRESHNENLRKLAETQQSANA